MIPWWAKIGAKIVLSRLPIQHSVWQKIGVFRHGAMDSSAYAQKIFRMHAEYAGYMGKLQGATILELGPGDGLATALLAAAHGAKALLIDTGDYASESVDSYFPLAKQLRAAGLACPDIESCRSTQGMLDACNAQYLTKGLQSLRELPDGCVDFAFSQSVLEHVRRHEFHETLVQCRRVLRPAAPFTHHVDLKDHLGGSLNNLRFSERLWESRLFTRSGFYTNRIRFSEMLDAFRRASFSAEWVKKVEWQQLPTSRTRMNAAFRSIPEDDLRVSGFDVLLR